MKPSSILQAFTSTMRATALATLSLACSARTASNVEPAADAGLDAAPNPSDAMDAADAVPSAPVPYVFTTSGDGNIRVFSIDLATGSLGKPTAYPTGAKPSFLALSPNGKHLFASDEANNSVLAFSVDRETGAVHKINELATGSAGPAHLSVDQTGKWVLVAHYSAGRYAVLGVDSDGRLQAVSDNAAVGIRAHYIAMDRHNKYSVIPCLGSDYVAIRQLNAATGKLSPAATAKVQLPAKSGPRHLAFSPDETFAYVNGETGSTVSTLTFDAMTGAMAVLETVTTLPPGFAGTNTTAEIAVHPNGAFVYVSNRGHNSIARFRRNATTGKLTLLGHTSTGGETPRSFSIDASGRVLIAANQTTGSIATFTVDASTGNLTPAGGVIAVPSPAYVGILAIQ